MKVKSVPVSFKAGPEDGLQEGEFIVYPSTFIRKPDAYGDVVAPGAFLDDIAARKEAGIVLPGLYGHRMDDPDFFIAAAEQESEDEHGWRIKGAFDLESPKGAQVYRLVKGRRLNQLSFAYDVLEEGKTDLGGGETANELRKLKVYEFSFVPVGANQDTSVVAVKSATEALEASLKAGATFSAANAKAIDETADQLIAHGKKLKDLLAAARGENDQGKASGTAEAKSGASDEEPPEAKSSAPVEEPKRSPSVARLAAQAHIYALTGAEGGSR